MSDEVVSEPRSARIDFGFTTALLVVLAVAAALLLVAFIDAASQPLGWAVACGVVAALVQPVISWLSRYMRRGFAVVLTILGIAVLLGGAWAGVATTVADNVNTLKESAPLAAAELEEDSEVARDFRLEERVTAFVEELDEDLGTTAQLRRTTSTVSTYVVTGVLTIFLIAYGEKLAAGALRQIRDERRRKRLGRIAHRAVTSWRRYSLTALAEVIVVTVVAWIALYLIDVPAPFVLGLLIGALAIIPFAGVLIGGIPALLFAAASGDLSKVVAVVALVVALQIVEYFAVRRRSDASSVYVGPALPLVVGLIGFEVYGIGGVIYGVLLLVLAIAVLDQLAEERGDPTSTELASGEVGSAARAATLD